MPNTYNARIDPGKEQLKSDAFSVGANIAGTTGKYALMGSKLGPWGTAGGAAIGLGMSLYETLSGRDERVESREDASADWLSQNVKNYTGQKSFKDGGKVKGYRKGGKIKGSGTTKSDSIRMDVEPGSFITPAENSSKALEMGKRWLGWKDSEVADRNQGNLDINVSNGEVIFTPDEANKLSGMGIDLGAELAPNAIDGVSGFFLGGYTDEEDILADITGQGTTIKNPLSPKGIDDIQLPDETLKILNNPGTMTGTAGSSDIPLSDFQTSADDADNEKTKFADILPEIAAGTQLAAGIAGTIAERKRPDITVSSKLQSLSAETTREAGYGLPPSVKNEMKKEAERERRSAVNAIIEEGGPGTMQKLQSILKGTIDKKLGIELADFEAQEKKKTTKRAVDMKIADMDYAAQKDAQDSWRESKAGFNALLTAGVSNIIGSQQAKKEAELLAELRDSSINFTLPS